jgi:hypothetical protein
MTTRNDGGPAPLTPTQRKVLQLAAVHESVSSWPYPLAVVRRCIARGFLEECGKEPGVFGFVKYRITSAGRAMLSEREKDRP